METPTASCLYPAVVDSVAFVAVVATVAAVAAGYSRPPARYPGSPRFPPFFFPSLYPSLSNFTVPCVSFFSFSFFLLFSNHHEPRHFLSPLGETKNAIRSSHGFRDEASRDIGRIGSDTFFGYRSAEKKKNLLSLRTLSTNYFSRRSITELFSLLSFFSLLLLSFSISHISGDVIFPVLHAKCLLLSLSSSWIRSTLVGNLVSYSFLRF